VILLQIPERSQLADVLVIGLLDSGVQVDGLISVALSAAMSEKVASYVLTEALKSQAGLVHALPLPGELPSMVLIVGLGAGNATDLRVAGVAMGRSIRGLPAAKRISVAIDAKAADLSRALAEGLVLGGYEFSLASSAQEVARTVSLAGDVDRVGIAAGSEVADAVNWARNLGNTPAVELTPARMGECAEDQLDGTGCRVRVHDESWLRAQRFGGLLAVGAGSVSGPRLIEVSWRPAGAKSIPHVVLVGKGITFDTGGLNLKRSGSMRVMHTDMCGGAAVLGAVQYAAISKLKVRVTALVPAAENAVSASAVRPSDVIRHFGGRTTEVGNTDAEGRLVLADALAYAVARLKPDAIIDVATLTGAMKVALGTGTAGYFANDDGLAKALEVAAISSDEPVWRMPLEHAYSSLLESSMADARNDPGNPGGITAALFLQHFVGEVAWAHLDIAGPARAAEAGPIFSEGATGFGVRLLSRYLEAVAG
jgi:leucyl aminopeptidase